MDNIINEVFNLSTAMVQATVEALTPQQKRLFKSLSKEMDIKSALAITLMEDECEDD